MKIDREQIEKMAQVMCGYCSTDGKCAVSKNLREPDVCANVDTEHCLYKEYTERLIENGCYGDVSEYKAEIEQLNKKLAKQIRIARDANAKFTNVEHYLRPFQYKAEVNKGCDDCKTVKQAKINILRELKERVKTAIDTYYDSDEENEGYFIAEDAIDDIDELIKEVQDE